MRVGKAKLTWLAVILALIAAAASFSVFAAFSEQAKLTANDGATFDFFGWSVDISGDTALVGAPQFGPQVTGVGPGAAYVYVRSGTTWTQQAKLTASDGAVGDFAGISVAISGDTALVGASSADDAGIASGAAYVFVRSGTIWTEQAKLVPGDAATGDLVGFSVDLSGDTAVVAARGDDDAGNFSGSAYVFVRTGTTWTQQAKLTASDAAGFDFFGSAVAISGDTIVAGALGDDDAGSVSGSAYVFVRSGTSWTEQAKLTASDGAAVDIFGSSVAINGDTAIAGARLHDDAGTNSGSAYVFVRSGTTWTEQTKLVPSDAAANDFFGFLVAISGDTAVVGAPLDDDDGSSSGSAYFFERTGSTWTEQSKLTTSDAASNDQFGWSVAITGDTAVVGAVTDDDGGDDSGSAYVFVAEPPVTVVNIDIKPSSDPNSINCNNQKEVIAVAILTTSVFDATTVDHSTVAFEGSGETHVNKKSGEPRRHEEDVDDDGDSDLVLHFRLGDTTLTYASSEATLTGETFAGEAVEGADSVRMVDSGGGS